MGLKEIVDLEKDYSRKISFMKTPIFNFCSSRIFNNEDAKDVAQNVLIILNSKKKLYDSEKSFYSWAFKICNFQIMAYLTKSKRSKNNMSFDSLGGVLLASEELCPFNSALKSELQKQRDDLIKDKISKLPNRQKNFMKYSLDGKSKKEIMLLMDISEVNYHAIKSRSILSLKLLLKNESDN